MAKRTNQIDRTRNAIIEAASEIIFGSISPEDFTMQNVADAAGVSHRTLYRYFDSRKALINAVGAEHDQKLESSVGADVLGSFDRWISSTSEIMEFGALHSEMLKRTLALSIAGGDWRSDRDEAYWGLFRQSFPNLDESTARQDFAVLRHIMWSSNAVLIGQRFDLTAGEVAAGIERAVGALVEEISRRDGKAQAGRKGS